MSTSNRIRKLARELRNPKDMRDQCQNELKTYKQQHPDMEQSDSEWVEKCVKREMKQEATRQVKDRKKDKQEKGKGKDTVTDPEDQKAMEEAGISEDISKEDLDESLGAIMDKHTPKGEKSKPGLMSLSEKIEWLAETIDEVVEFDTFVMGLPEKAKRLAQWFHDKAQKKKEKQQEQAKAKAEEGSTYEEYVEWKKSRHEQPLSKEEWEAQAKGEGDKGEGDKGEGDKGEGDKGDKKPKKKYKRPLPDVVREDVEKTGITDDDLDEIRRLPRNRSMSDKAFFDKYWSLIPKELQFKLKAAERWNAKGFRELHEALWEQEQP